MVSYSRAALLGGLAALCGQELVHCPEYALHCAWYPLRLYSCGASSRRACELHPPSERRSLPVVRLELARLAERRLCRRPASWESRRHFVPLISACHFRDADVWPLLDVAMEEYALGPTVECCLHALRPPFSSISGGGGEEGGGRRRICAAAALRAVRAFRTLRTP